jgi:hypothetical protein
MLDESTGSLAMIFVTEFQSLPCLPIHRIVWTRRPSATRVMTGETTPASFTLGHSSLRREQGGCMCVLSMLPVARNGIHDFYSSNSF